MLVISDHLSIPLRELDFTFVRSSGPGGQNVNKVSSKAVLRWKVAKSASLPETVRQRFIAKYRRRISSEGDLLLTSQRFRDQGRNVADCMAKLRQMVIEASKVPKRRKPTRPTRGSQERRLLRKKEQSAKKRSRNRPIRED
jgi:ribosome-associated protein